MDILSKGRTVSKAKAVEPESVCLPKASHFSWKTELQGASRRGACGRGCTTGAEPEESWCLKWQAPQWNVIYIRPRNVRSLLAEKIN